MRMIRHRLAAIRYRLAEAAYRTKRGLLVAANELYCAAVRPWQRIDVYTDHEGGEWKHDLAGWRVPSELRNRPRYRIEDGSFIVNFYGRPVHSFVTTTGLRWDCYNRRWSLRRLKNYRCGA